MLLHWFGHSCFKMTFANGTSIVTDPFDSSVGYPVPETDADVVTCSHGHFDHNYAEAVSGSPVVLRETGSYTVGGVTIDGIASFHDPDQGTKRGPNVIYRYKADGLTIVHLGDLGHMPSEEQFAFISGADLMLIPIGGFYTIDTDTAVAIVRKAAPKCAVAMHFKTPVMNFPISDESQFASSLNAAYIGASDWEITPGMDLPAAAVMAY